MAGKKATTNKSAGANDPPAATDVEGTAGPKTASKLRWTSLKDAHGVAHRTKKPRAKKTRAIKAGTTTTQEDAAKAHKLSALNAAAKVLQESGRPMNCQQMIQVMAAKGYWTSPAGKTPAATLFSAIMRETKTKGNQARFQKTARGQFAYQTPRAS